MLTVEQIKTAQTPYDPSPEYAEHKAEEEAFSRGEGPVPRLRGYVYGGNRGQAGAWRKGALAAAEGKSLDACPYRDHRTYRGGVTFSRAFQRAWGEGWHFAKHEGDDSKCGKHPFHDGECGARA